MNKLERKKVTDLVDVIFQRIVVRICWMLLFGVLIQYVYNAMGFNADSTDGQTRSGMMLHVDNLTGCHYLSVRNGGCNSAFRSSRSSYLYGG